MDVAPVIEAPASEHIPSIQRVGLLDGMGDLLLRNLRRSIAALPEKYPGKLLAHRPGLRGARGMGESGGEGVGAGQGRVMVMGLDKWSAFVEPSHWLQPLPCESPQPKL